MKYPISKLNSFSKLPFLRLSASQAPFTTAATVEIGFFSPANALPHGITIGMARTEAILTRELLKGIPWESEFEGRKTEEMENCYFLFPPSDQGWTLCLERSLQRLNLWYCEHPTTHKAISASRRRGNEESLRCWRWSDGKANLQIFVPSILVLSGSKSWWL